MVINGLDHSEVDYTLAKGLTFYHCPSNLSSESLAQSAMFFILLLAGRYKETAENFFDGVLYSPIPYGLSDRTLTIVGYGASGSELAKRAATFGMTIWAIDFREISARERAEMPRERVGGPDQLAEFAAETDVLSVHLQLTDATRHVISRELVAATKSSTWVFDVARGAPIDEDALCEALLAGRIGGAARDAFAEEPPQIDHPVYRLTNVYVTPHTAGGSELTFENRARFCADNLDRLARAEEPLGRVTGALVKA